MSEDPNLRDLDADDDIYALAAPIAPDLNEVLLSGLGDDDRLGSGIPREQRLTEDDFVNLSGITRPAVELSRPSVEATIIKTAVEVQTSKVSFAEPGIADVDADEAEMLMPEETPREQAVSEQMPAAILQEASAEIEELQEAALHEEAQPEQVEALEPVEIPPHEVLEELAEEEEELQQAAEEQEEPYHLEQLEQVDAPDWVLDTPALVEPEREVEQPTPAVPIAEAPETFDALIEEGGEIFAPEPPVPSSLAGGLGSRVNLAEAEKLLQELSSQPRELHEDADDDMAAPVAAAEPEPFVELAGPEPETGDDFDAAPVGFDSAEAAGPAPEPPIEPNPDSMPDAEPAPLPEPEPVPEPAAASAANEDYFSLEDNAPETPLESFDVAVEVAHYEEVSVEVAPTAPAAMDEIWPPQPVPADEVPLVNAPVEKASTPATAPLPITPSIVSTAHSTLTIAATGKPDTTFAEDEERGGGEAMPPAATPQPPSIPGIAAGTFARTVDETPAPATRGAWENSRMASAPAAMPEPEHDFEAAPARRHSSRHSRRRKRLATRAAAGLMFAALAVCGFVLYQEYLHPAIRQPDEILAEAQRQMALQNHAEASVLFEQFARQAPEHPARPDAQFEAALAMRLAPASNATDLRAQGLRAVSLLEQFIRDNPAHKHLPRAKSLLGILYYETGEHEKAIALLRELAEELDDPLAALPVLRALARSYGKSNALNEAEATYLQAAALPKNYTPDHDYFEAGELFALRHETESDPALRQQFLEQATHYFGMAMESPGLDPDTRNSIEQRMMLLSRDGNAMAQTVPEPAPVEMQALPAEASPVMKEQPASPEAREPDPMLEAEQLKQGAPQQP